MSKSIKFKNNNYLDSEGVSHNRRTLKAILDKTPIYFQSGRGSSSYIWSKISTFTSNVAYYECNAVLLLKGKHSSNSDECAIINIGISMNAEGKISKKKMEILSRTANFNTQDFYMECSDNTANLWIKHNQQYSTWSITILQNDGWTFPLSGVNTTTSTLPSTGFTKAASSTNAVSNTNSTYGITTTAVAKNGIVTLTIYTLGLEQAINSGSQSIVLIELPTTYKPPNQLNQTVTTSNGNRFNLQVLTSGVVQISYAYTNVPAGVGSQICYVMTYIAE